MSKQSPKSVLVPPVRKIIITILTDKNNAMEFKLEATDNVEAIELIALLNQVQDQQLANYLLQRARVTAAKQEQETGKPHEFTPDSHGFCFLCGKAENAHNALVV